MNGQTAIQIEGTFVIIIGTVMIYHIIYKVYNTGCSWILGHPNLLFVPLHVLNLVKGHLSFCTLVLLPLLFPHPHLPFTRQPILVT